MEHAEAQVERPNTLTSGDIPRLIYERTAGALDRLLRGGGAVQRSASAGLPDRAVLVLAGGENRGPGGEQLEEGVEGVDVDF